MQRGVPLQVAVMTTKVPKRSRQTGNHITQVCNLEAANFHCEMHFMSGHKESEIGPADMTAVAAAGTHLFVTVSLVARCSILVTQFYIYLRS